MNFLPRMWEVRRVVYEHMATVPAEESGTVEEFGYATCQQWIGWRWRNVSVRTMRIGREKGGHSNGWYDIDTGCALSLQEGRGGASWLGCAFEEARYGNALRARFQQATGNLVRAA